MRSAVVHTVSFLAGIFALVAAAGAVSGLTSAAVREAAMPYADCLALLDEIAAEEGAVANVSDTAEGRSARLEAADGIVSVSCNRSAATVTLKGLTRLEALASR